MNSIKCTVLLSSSVADVSVVVVLMLKFSRKLQNIRKAFRCKDIRMQNCLTVEFVCAAGHYSVSIPNCNIFIDVFDTLKCSLCFNLLLRLLYKLYVLCRLCGCAISNKFSELTSQIPNC